MNGGRWLLLTLFAIGCGDKELNPCLDGYVRDGADRCIPEEAETCVPEDPLDRRLWRLSQDEYRRTVTDLMGFEQQFTAVIAEDARVDGFSTDADALTVSPLLSHQYRVAAEGAAAQADLALLVECNPEEGSAVCATEFINDFGLRTFRRPLQEDEVQRYVDLWFMVAESDGFEPGIRFVIGAMLQSPHFLYRSEMGTQDSAGRFTLSDWEIASALSYTLWGTMPDDALFAAALAGELQTSSQIAFHVERMKEDSRFLDTAAEFVEVWLHLERLQTVSREGLTSELRAAMAAETRTLSREIAWIDGTLSDLMEVSVSKMDPALAAHHGLEADTWVDLSGHRDGGLLGQASVHTTFALPTTSSPVHRGAMVRRYLLCETLDLPPPEFQAAPPEPDTDATTRDLYADHMTAPECASCHLRIDPLGFGFENYDSLGRYRELEGGLSIDSSGNLDSLEFFGVSGLSDALLDDARFRACFSWTWTRWKTGSDTCVDDPGDVGFTEPLLELVMNERFGVRLGGNDEGDTMSNGRLLDTSSLVAIASTVGEAAIIVDEEDLSCENLPAGDPSAGESSFLMYCSDCHADDGGGEDGRGPDLENRVPESDQRICEIVTEGYFGMPSVEISYSDIADVTAYLRSIFPDG